MLLRGNHPERTRHIELRPLRPPQLAGAYEGQSLHTQRQSDNSRSFIMMDRPHHCRCAIPIHQCRKMPLFPWRKRSPKVPTGVTGDKCRSDSISKNLRADRECPAGRLQSSPLFNRLDHAQDFNRGNVLQRDIAKFRINVASQPLLDRFRMTRSPCCPMKRNPFVGYVLKGFLRICSLVFYDAGSRPAATCLRASSRFSRASFKPISG